MSFVHDIIKQQYSYEGYLPNYPYHLISDKEMFDAFIFNESNYFDTNYPRDLISSDSELSIAYDNLKEYIVNCIEAYQTTLTPLPDWIYSYMIGATISVNSEEKDIHDLLTMLGERGHNDTFTLSAAKKCFEVSKRWIEKISIPSVNDKSELRPATLFGEPHIIKSLRLNPLVTL